MLKLNDVNINVNEPSPLTWPISPQFNEFSSTSKVSSNWSLVRFNESINNKMNECLHTAPFL